MNSCREFEGKNVEKAVELACQTLKISKNQLKYDVVSTGTSGIFSIIRNKKAKIRVNIEPAKKTNQRVQSLVDEAFGVKKQKPSKKPDNARKADSTRKPDTPRKPDTQNGKKKKFEKPRAKKQDTPRAPEKKVEQPRETVEKEKIISDFYKGRSSEDIGREVLETILKYITESVEITLDMDGDTMVYHVNSEDSAVIIGKRGQNLEAIQYIVDKIVNKHTLERKRVLIDVEGYLEKRRENLEKMALRMSEKVKKTGKPSTISQMSSQDRRIVHLALKDDKSVRTQSMGEGYYRRLVIFPKKGRHRKKKS